MYYSWEYNHAEEAVAPRYRSDSRRLEAATASTRIASPAASRAGSARLSSLSRRQRSVFCLSSLGALTVGFAAVNWRSIAHGYGQHTGYIPGDVTLPTILRRSVHSSTQGLFSAFNFNTSDNSNMANLVMPGTAVKSTHTSTISIHIPITAVSKNLEIRRKLLRHPRGRDLVEMSK